MIRLNIKIVPKSRLVESNKCTSLNTPLETSIRYLLPDILPTNFDNGIDQFITHIYSSISSPNPIFKLSPYKPEQNKVKFTLKKSSSFRFEMIYYPCILSPIIRNAKLTSISKTHNKILRETVGTSIPGIGNSMLLYVDELLPGNYELEIQYGWLKDYDTVLYKNLNDLADFQIEIFSLQQNQDVNELMMDKDRHIRQLQTVVRDLSIVAFTGTTYNQYIGQSLIIPTHPPDKANALAIPFKIVPEHAQVLLNSFSTFKYIESIEIQNKANKAMIKRIHGGTENFISEILQRGDYILQFNYNDNKDKKLYTKPHTIDFGISDYENVKLFKR